MQKSIQKYVIHDEKELDSIYINITSGDRIFFIGDLGSGKSTFIRHILRKYLNNPSLVVRSPTYTYYQKYLPPQSPLLQRGEVASETPSPLGEGRGEVYHFDLYRIEDYDTYISIGGEEITNNPDSIVLIEWPEILGNRVNYTKKISINVLQDGLREIIIES